MIADEIHVNTKTKEVYIYFNNDIAGLAIKNAKEMPGVDENLTGTLGEWQQSGKLERTKKFFAFSKAIENVL